MRRLVLLLGLALSSGLQAQTTVTIQRTSPGHWRAEYRLPEPIISLRFSRPAGFYRERVWSLATPGYRLARQGDWQVVRLDSGAVARAELTFEFPEFAETLPKEYELFQPFSDGAVALYTGHFDAEAESAAGGKLVVHELRILPPAGTHAVVRGRVVRGPVRYSDPQGEGSYIYLGTARPLETPDMLAIVDPGLPPWLSALFRERLPQLFRAYRTRLGAALPWKPVVLYSYNPAEISGYSSGGGTLTGLLNMTLTGTAWRTANPAAAAQAFHLIAHESAHLWNGQLVAADSQAAGAWIHEGGADALADELLLGFGLTDSAGYRARHEEELNRCAAAVAGGPVATALSRGVPREVYDCGVVLALWTVAALPAPLAEADGGALFGFWRALLRAARAHGGRYDQALYFTTLRELGAPARTTEAMQAFLAGRDSMSVAVREMQRAGLAVREGEGEPPPAMQSENARAAMVHLMRQACNGRVDFGWGNPVRTGAVSSCAPFAAAMQIYRIQGFRVRDQGAALYDAVAMACGAGGAVTLEAEDGAVLSSVLCGRPLAPLPVWYELAP